MVYLTSRSYIHLKNNSHKNSFSHDNHRNLIFPQDTESVLSFFLSAPCFLSPQVAEWVVYGTLQLLNDFAGFHREKLVCEVLSLNLASGRMDLTKVS